MAYSVGSVGFTTIGTRAVDPVEACFTELENAQKRLENLIHIESQKREASEFKLQQQIAGLSRFTGKFEHISKILDTIQLQLLNMNKGKGDLELEKNDVLGESLTGFRSEVGGYSSDIVVDLKIDQSSCNDSIDLEDTIAHIPAKFDAVSKEIEANLNIIQSKPITVDRGENWVDLSCGFNCTDDIVKGCVESLDIANKSTSLGVKKRAQAQHGIFNSADISVVIMPQLVGILKMKARQNVIPMSRNDDELLELTTLEVRELLLSYEFLGDEYWPPPMISIVKVYVALQMPVKIYLKLNCKMLVVSDNGRGLNAYYVENYIRGGVAYEYLTCPTSGDGVIVMGSLDHSLFKVVVHREIEVGGVKLSNIRAIDHFYESPGENLMYELLRSDPQPQPRSGSSRNGVGLSFGAKFVTLYNEGRMEMWNMSRDFIFSQNYLGFLAVIFININLKTTFVNDEKLEFQDGSLIMSYMVGMFYEIVGQEVMKASSRKFHSLLSFFDPNFVELPSTEPFDPGDLRPLNSCYGAHISVFGSRPFDPGDLRPLNSCYDAHISVFGSRLEEKLIEAKVFLVESGALFWEKYFKRLINVIDYCHSRGVFQSENLLFDVAGNLRVSNLELTALSQQVRNDGLLHSACGTPNYATLEVFSDQGSDGEAAKLIWPCGVILLALLAGYLHFDDSIWILYMRDENAGLNPIAIITELKNRHVQGKIIRGINVRKGYYTNIFKDNVVQLLLVSTSAISLATECIFMIMKKLMHSKDDALLSHECYYSDLAN